MMKLIIGIFSILFLGQSLTAAHDSLVVHIQIDTIQSYTKDSCLTLLTVFNDNVVIEKRNAILTWFKVKPTKEYRKERGMNSKYGMNLDLVNHGERIEYLDSGKVRISSYELGILNDSKLLDHQGEVIYEKSYSHISFHPEESVTYDCSQDILYVQIISEYGMPKKIRNKRKVNY